MKVIDKRTKKNKKKYKYGDVLMCWDDDPSHYDLYRISNYADHPLDRKSTRLNSSHFTQSRMPSSA